MLDSAITPLLNPLEEVAEAGLRVELKNEKIRSFFSIIVSYYCDISDARDMSAVPH